ncbi:MAG: methyltransferase domain-containing protein [Bacteroidetes bacterium]|nr:methyltransferase domain-containing protein [Bacteroidota bacterium]
MRLMQHKKEAYWFYRFLSVFYDKYVNPLFWTEEMRDESLKLADLGSPDLKVADVGSGTGFTTQGIVKQVPASQLTCVDQSPHQMAKARRKADLQDCTFLEGDAENLPLETDTFDRYVSAGSIEYWPNPQQGINESYRIIKPGGKALMIGPLEPGSWFPRFIANLWMLFPKEKEYREWYENAGFTDIKSVYIRPHWHTTKRSEYGIAIVGTKPKAGLSPSQKSVKDREKSQSGLVRGLQMGWRVLVGSLAGFLFIPIALLGYLRSTLSGNGDKKLNANQRLALLLIVILAIVLIWMLT